MFDFKAGDLRRKQKKTLIFFLEICLFVKKSDIVKSLKMKKKSKAEDENH